MTNPGLFIDFWPCCTTMTSCSLQPTADGLGKSYKYVQKMSFFTIVMDGCSTDVISKIAQTPRKSVPLILKGESVGLEVTKSLLNLLYNAVIVGSLPVSLTQKAFFDQHSDLVRSLLSTSKSFSLKKALLTEHPALVINIAGLCPTAVGSSSRKRATNNLGKIPKKPKRKRLYQEFSKLTI